MFSKWLSKFNDLPLNDIKLITENQHAEMFINDIMSMYTYKKLDYNTSRLLEFLLIFSGCAYVGYLENDNEKIVVGMPTTTRETPINDDGTLNIQEGVTITGKKIINGVVVRNNPSYSRDMGIICRYANKLSRIEFSEDKLVDKSVCNPIPIAKNNAMFEGIKKALENCGNSDIMVLFDNERNKNFSLREDGAGNNETSYDLIDFTNVSYSDKFKYLSAYHDDIMRRFFTMFGMSSYSPTKQAQTNDSELENRDKISMIYPDLRLKTRNEDLQIFGIEVEYNELWKVQLDEMKNDTGVAENEN